MIQDKNAAAASCLYVVPEREYGDHKRPGEPSPHLWLPTRVLFDKVIIGIQSKKGQTMHGRITVTVIVADVGGYVDYSSMHPDLIKAAQL